MLVNAASWLLCMLKWRRRRFVVVAGLIWFMCFEKDLSKMLVCCRYLLTSFYSPVFRWHLPVMQICGRFLQYVLEFFSTLIFSNVSLRTYPRPRGALRTKTFVLVLVVVFSLKSLSSFSGSNSLALRQSPRS